MNNGFGLAGGMATVTNTTGQAEVVLTYEQWLEVSERGRS